MTASRIQAALVPALALALCATPGPAGAAGRHEAELVFPLHHQHNHAPGIAELGDGSLLVSWFRGSGERTADDVAVYGSRRAVGSDEWSEPFLLVDNPGFPDGNTALFIDARERLWLFWPVVLANTWESVLSNYRISEDYLGDGPPRWSWQGALYLQPRNFEERMFQGLEERLALGDLSEPVETQLRQLEARIERFEARRDAGELSENDAEQLEDMRELLAPGALEARRAARLERLKEEIGDKLASRLGWQVRCKPTVLPSGRILLPLYSDTYSVGLMAISDDLGATWYASEPLAGFGNIQPSVLRRDDGTLVAYMRENGPLDRIRVSESTDDGITWGPVGMSELPNPGSGLDGVRLANGHWVLVYNDTTRGRSRLAVSLSEDEGRSWPWTRHLEHHDSGSYHYPVVIQGGDETIHAVYSYFVEEGRAMKHAAFDEAWIRAAE